MDATRRGKTLTLAAIIVTAGLAQAETTSHPLLGVLQNELEHAQTKLESPEGVRPYFIQYAVTDTRSVRIDATLGALTADAADHDRMLDVDVRCGDYALDNTRQIRGGRSFGSGRSGGFRSLPLGENDLAVRHALWLTTDSAFKDAVKRLAQVKANLKVKVDEEDPADDFTREEPAVYTGPWIEQSVDRKSLAAQAKALSARFRKHPSIYASNVTVSGNVTNKLMVNTEGSRVQTGKAHWRIGIRASTVADDGMELFLHDAFDAATPKGLPDDATLTKAVDALAEKLLALRAAPVVDPYTGPAILMHRASGVFFHEIFGHRIEGHRQKNVDEGQTFAKMIDTQVLPEFLSVVDDPSMKRFDGIDLNGYYAFDDECVRGQPTRIVENGTLKTFLLSRTPTRGFTKSNGHGRRQPGRAVVSRQGNLTVHSTNQVSFETLRKKLVALCIEQDKPYGLLFADISGGFTTTQRYGPQAFKVIPLLVYRVYADGRPDELVRGVDIVGTPLTSFSKIVCTADDADVFNGFCGAESGSVPVSAISPSILIEQIEVEKKQKAQDRPPILPSPLTVAAPEKG